VYRPPIYFHGIRDAPGVVAANNFLSIFNPVSSVKVLVFLQADISVYAVGGAGGSESLAAYRITAASGGTQITPAAVNRFNTLHGNPAAEVRVGNPSVTTDATFVHSLGSWQPPQTTGIGGAVSATVQAPGDGFICLPGQGVVFNTVSGDVDQRWKILSVWLETAL
jgi:hypothetical protein